MDEKMKKIGSTFLLIFIGVTMFLIAYNIFNGMFSTKLCVISTPASGEYFCSRLNKTVIDLNLNIDRILAYTNEYGCVLQNYTKNDKRYEIKECDLDKYDAVKKFILSKTKI